MFKNCSFTLHCKTSNKTFSLQTSKNCSEWQNTKGTILSHTLLKRFNLIFNFSHKKLNQTVWKREMLKTQIIFLSYSFSYANYPCFWNLKKKTKNQIVAVFIWIYYLRALLPIQTCYAEYFQHTALSAKFNCNTSIFKVYSPCRNTHVIHSGLSLKKQNKTKTLKHSLSNKQRIK